MGQAHGLRLEHAIFHGPREVLLEWSEVDTPKHYADWPGGDELGAKLRVWTVQRGEFPNDWDVGLVSDPYGFEDSPDCEWISSGINSKGPTAMALGRQANLFLWGFAGDPTHLTESGKAVFVNTLVYMRPFAGAPKLVPASERATVLPAREWALVYARYARRKVAGPELAEWLESRFPDSARAACGLDAAKLEAYYQEHLEFLRPAGERGFAVDPDLVELGVGNRSKAFLGKLVLRWKAAPGDPLCQRLASRYVAAGPFADAASLERWIAEAGERLFFSDCGGFQWRVAPVRKSPPTPAPTR